MARILLVEDNSDISALFKEALESAGYAVDVAVDGKIGVDMAVSTHYDLILLDLMLPGKHGMQVLQELRGADQTKHTPVYILSAQNDQILMEQSKNIGANGFLVKSDVNPGELIEKVGKYLGRA